MKQFLFFVSLLRPYKLNVIVHLFFYILTAIFTLISIPAILPLFEVLFQENIVITPKPAQLASISDYIDLVKYEFTSWLQKQDKSTSILYICIGLTLIFFFKNLFRYLAIFIMAPVRTGIVRDIRQKIFNKLMDLPLAYFNKERKGDLIARMTTDVQEVEVSIVSTIEAFVKDPILIIGSIGFMLYMSVSLSLFVFILIFFTAFVIGGITRALRRNSMIAQNLMGDLISVQEESLGGLRVIKSFAAENYVKSKFDDIINQFRNIASKISRRRDLAVPLSEFLGISVVCVLLYVGANYVFSHQISSSSLLAFLYAFFNIIEPSKALSAAYFNIQKGAAALTRIEEVLHTQEQIKDHPTAKRKTEFTSSIRFENVSFWYDNPQNKIINNISFSIPKGTKLAIVGSSGAGKTTLVDLIMRFYDVTEGRILIDEIDIKEIKLSDLRSLFGMVTQEPILFNDSIRNNILFGDVRSTDAEVWKAVDASYSSDFVRDKQDGLDHNIGDRGLKLSGGQRQRITLSRAILRNPEILILDEATSSLDSNSEKMIQTAMNEILDGKTAFIIAHRLSTIKNADLIIVLQEGQVIEQGSHEALLMLKGEYYNFASLQSFS